MPDIRVTDQSIIIEVTNTVHGMLEQGGVSGQVLAYPLDEAMRLTGLSKDELEHSDSDDHVEGYHFVTIAELLSHHLKPRVIRKGHRIE